MRYITHRRFKARALCGDVNIPAQSICECINGIIYYNKTPICSIQSENAHQYFSLDADNKGMERGALTQAIQKQLSKKDGSHQERWDKIWDDEVCKKYKRTDHEDHWLWNHKFFDAPIMELRYIANLIGVKEKI